MRIRPAVPEDVSVIARCIMMAEGEMIPFLTGCEDEAGALEKLTGWMLSGVPNRYSLAHTLVAEADGAAAGAGISFPADDQDSLDVLILEDVRRRGREMDRLFHEGVPGTFYLSTMGVDPAFRKRGIGTALMRAAEEKAAGTGFSRTSLLVDTGKDRAKAMYERYGFRTVEEVRLLHFTYSRMVHDLGVEE